LLIAEALRRQDRLAQQVEALEAVVERLPNDALHKAALDTARRAAGMLVRRVTPEPDAEPARACIGFTIPPARRSDWRAEDWVRADPALPNLPTIGESVKGYAAPGWFSFVAPAGTPSDIVNKLNALVHAAVKADQAGHESTGGEIQISSPAEFAKLQANDTAMWARVTKAAGMEPE
jgi:hypothetical protein